MSFPHGTSNIMAICNISELVCVQEVTVIIMVLVVNITDLSRQKIFQNHPN